MLNPRHLDRTVITEEELLASLEDAVARAGSQRALALRTGLSVELLSQVRRRLRPPTPVLARELGYDLERVYRRRA